MLVARKYEDLIEYDYGFQKQEQQKPKTTVKKNKANKTAKSLLRLGVTFVIGFTIVVRFAMLNEMAMNINKQKEHLESLNKTNSQLKTQLSVDLRTIDEISRTKLGMEKPQQYQIVYVDTSKVQSGSDVEKKDLQEGSKFAGRLEKIVALLD